MRGIVKGYLQRAHVTRFQSHTAHVKHVLTIHLEHRVAVRIKDDVNQSVNVSDIHLSVTIHVNSGDNIRIHLVTQDHINQGIHVGNVHLAVTVGVTLHATHVVNKRSDLAVIQAVLGSDCLDGCIAIDNDGQSIIFVTSCRTDTRVRAIGCVIDRGSLCSATEVNLGTLIYLTA